MPLLSYRESLGRRETGMFAALVVAAAIVAGMVTTMVVAALSLDLPDVYSPDQLLFR